MSIFFLWGLCMAPVVGLAQSETFVHNSTPLPPKLGILMIADDLYANSHTDFIHGIDAFYAQVVPKTTLVPLELVTKTIQINPSNELAVFNSLLAADVRAFVAPNLHVQLITATSERSSSEWLVEPRQSRGNTLGIHDPISVYTDMQPKLERLINQLKFEGQLQQPILLYDETDTFSQLCFGSLKELLMLENVSYTVYPFVPGDTDYSPLWNQIKFSNPGELAFICAWERDAYRLREHAFKRSKLKSHIIGIVAENEPLVFHLQQETASSMVEVTAQKIIAKPAVEGKLIAKFQDSISATQVYLGLWILASQMNIPYLNNDMLTEEGQTWSTLWESPAGDFTNLWLSILATTELQP